MVGTGYQLKLVSKLPHWLDGIGLYDIWNAN